MQEERVSFIPDSQDRGIYTIAITAYGDVLCSSHTLVLKPQADNQLVRLEQFSFLLSVAQFQTKGRLGTLSTKMHFGCDPSTYCVGSLIS